MPVLYAVLCGLVGLAVGAWLTVIVSTVRSGEAVASREAVRSGDAVRSGRSLCPECAPGAPARAPIPLVSWVLLGGRCRRCRRRLAVRYPIVEGVTALLFALTAVRVGASWSLPAELAFVAGVVALGAVDLDRYLLPRAILYPTLALVLGALLVAAGATGQWARLGRAGACGAGLFGLFFLLHVIRPAWLGFGDVRLAALLGLALGWMSPWYLLIGLLAANLAGVALAVVLMMMGRANRSTPLPYGTFLGAGCVFALLTGGPIIVWYSRHFVT